jgi:hypothetical protein
LSFKALLRDTSWADRVLFSLLLAVSLAGVFFIKDIMPQGQSVTIEVDGKPAYILPIDKDRILSVQGPIGQTIVEIKDRKVRVTDSPCGNKFCIKQGWVGSGSIICLPNRVVVTIGNKDKKKGPDAITG